MLAWLKKLGAKSPPPTKGPTGRERSLPSALGEGNPDTAQRTLFEAAAHQQQAGNLEQAAALYRQVLQINSGHFEALTALGKFCLETGEKEEGLLLMARAVQLAPESAPARNNLAVACAANEQHEDALVAFQQAIELSPGNRQYLRNAIAAAIELRQSQVVAQLLVLWRAMQSPGEPFSAEYFYFLGVQCQQQGNFAEAETAFRSAYALRQQMPDEFGLFLRLGYVLLNLDRREEALQIWEEGCRAFPNEVSALHNLAAVAAELGEKDKAQAFIQRILEIKPDAPDARLALSTFLLGQGDYAQGWAGYESRVQTALLAADLARFDPECRWQGEVLDGKTLIVWGEQGLGDQIQFFRYLPLLGRFQPGEVIVICHPSLISLFSAVDRKIRCLSHNDPQPPYDYFVPLLSLPKIFGTRLENIPCETYLQADPVARQQWSARLAADKQRRVGLVWGGNPRRHNIEQERMDRRRSISLADYAPLWSVPGISFYSLQKGEATEQLADWPSDVRPLIDWTAELNDFSDSAALVMNLDLVISVDTSVVHLAGALGQPVWVLSRLDGCWRWLEERDDSPWYPSARIFRQKRYGDWTETLENLHAALLKWQAQHG